MSILKRHAEDLAIELAETYPVVAILGPRQSGKSTLAKMLFSDLDYVTLGDPDTGNFAQQDARGFLQQYRKGAVIDEIQRCPELLSYMQTVVDEDKRSGQFIITGSQQFGLMRGVTQSLAGRVGLLELLPFSVAELVDQGHEATLNHFLLQGLYPPIYDRDIRAELWVADYIRTYLERDVRELIQVRDLSLFQRFLKLLAARNGQLINYSELSNAADIDQRTVKQWLSVLEASYIVHFLRPHYRNFSKQLVKSPRIYFYDPGLVVNLLGLREEDIPLTPYRGALFETLIIAECKKYNSNYRLRYDFHFWRDSRGVEVDLMFERGQKITAIELKSSATVHQGFWKNLRKYNRYAADYEVENYVITGGDQVQHREEATILPWKTAIADILFPTA